MTLHTRLTGLSAATALSVCLLAAPAALAQAMPPPDGPEMAGPGFGQRQEPMQEPMHEPMQEPMHEPMREPGPFGTPPFLRGLGLSDAQNDRVFTILHGQAPKRRALEIAERKADEALHDLAREPALDQARATTAAQALGRAIADQELLRLQTRALLKAVLTPEQRAQLDAPRGKGRRGDHKNGKPNAKEASK